MNLCLFLEAKHFNYFDLLEPSSWPYEEITSLWKDGGAKSYHLREILKHETLAM